MPIYINNKKMKKGFIGDKSIKKIYLGFDLIWSSSVSVSGEFKPVQIFYTDFAPSPSVTIGDGERVIIPYEDIIAPIIDFKGTYKIIVNTLDGIVYDENDNERGYAYPTPGYSDDTYTGFNGFAIDYWTPEEDLGPGTYYVQPVVEASITGLVIAGEYTVFTNIKYIPYDSEESIYYPIDDCFTLEDENSQIFTYIFSSAWEDDRPDATTGIFELS